MLDTVLFDMGGTLEDISYSLDTYDKANKAIYNILTDNGIAVPLTEDAFWNKMFRGMNDYRKWAEEHQIELKPEDIWGKWCLKDMAISESSVNKIAEELAHTWEDTYFTRKLRDGVQEMLKDLKQSGFKLGIISNTASLYHVFRNLKRYGIREYFDSVTLSSITGYRKPSTNIFEIALYEIDSKPENCVYVGDTRSRDVIGPKKAGFAHTIQIESFLTAKKDVSVLDGEPTADYSITEISEVTDIMHRLKSV